MKKHISYPKINQFRNTVRDIKRQSSFVKMHVSGDGSELPVFDEGLPCPIIGFKGTVKLHGTNAAVSYNKKEGIWFQSRNKIITPEEDNAGFASFANNRSEIFQKMAEFLALKFSLNLDTHTITIFGEWAGKGIQKGVAISELPKAFFIFGAKATSHADNEGFWINLDKISLSHVKSGIFNIEGFPTFSINIDFSSPEVIRDKLMQYTEMVERACPVAGVFQIEGIGEGVVWTGEYQGIIHRFKVKGQKHSISKVSKPTSVNVEKVRSITEFIDYAVTDNRFEQALSEIFQDKAPDIKRLGGLIKWVVKDINTEESDVLEKNGLIAKDIGKSVAARVKEKFLKLI